MRTFSLSALQLSSRLRATTPSTAETVAARSASRLSMAPGWPALSEFHLRCVRAEPVDATHVDISSRTNIGRRDASSSLSVSAWAMARMAEVSRPSAPTAPMKCWSEGVKRNGTGSLCANSGFDEDSDGSRSLECCDGISALGTGDDGPCCRSIG